MQTIYTLVLLAISMTTFGAGKVDPVKVDYSFFTLDNKKVLAIVFENEKKWHTYWKNPGDAGTEIKIKFFENGNEVKLPEYPWPTPKRYIEQGDIWAYGYGGKYALFFDVPAQYTVSKLNVDAQWLVCKDICIPGGKKFTANLGKVVNPAPIIETGKLKEIFQKLPQKAELNFEFYLNKGDSDDSLSLYYMIENVDSSQIDEGSNVVFPYHKFPFDYKHEEIVKDPINKILYGRFKIDWDGIYEEPVWNLPTDGVFKTPITAQFLITYPKGERNRIVSKTFDQFSLTGNEAMEKIFDTTNTPQASEKLPTQNNIFLILLFGFLGGLILNLMPCVLPVISLKLFGLVAHSDESQRKILKHNLAYTAGVLASFWVLGIIIIAIKATGSKIGWGFQLQSPLFVFVMLLLIFILALNMLGLFEFVTPGGRVLGNTEMKKGFSGDFFNGVLATILSTPCSAPFLGTALTYALTTGTLNIFLVFTFIGLGLAFPFILTGFFPKMIRFLPKPGAWMEKLKNILGLTLLLTVVWLYDVLDGLIDFEFAGLYINSILVFVFFGFFLRKKITKNPFATVGVFFIPVLLLAQALNMKAFEVSTQSSATQSSRWKPWSPSAMAAAPAPTFINFTAKWCLTCKVNKKLVLESDEFKELVAQEKIHLLEGDWTKRDQAITTFLEQNNLVGVPAYFIKKKNGEIINLGETISINKIKKHL